MDPKEELAAGLALELFVNQASDHSIEKLQQFARKLIEKFESPWLNLEFRCQMLAQVFTPKGSRLLVNADLTVVDLCERFCKKRLADVHREQSVLSSYRTFEVAAFDFFKMAAAKKLFLSHQSLWKNKTFFKGQEAEFDFTGFICNGQFVDDSLANYFASLAVLELLEQKKSPAGFESFLFSTLLAKESHSLQPVRHFLSLLLSKKKEKIPQHSVNERWIDFLTPCFELCQAEGNSALFQLLVDSLRNTCLQRPHDRRANRMFQSLRPFEKAKNSSPKSGKQNKRKRPKEQDLPKKKYRSV